MTKQATAAAEPAKAVQGPARQPSSAGAKVTVACKLPHGLRIRAFEFVTENEPVMGGGIKEVRVARPRGEPILINGTAFPFGQVPNYRIVAGYALTEGVDKDTWDAWLEDNKNSAMVRNGMIFAYEKTAEAVDAAKDHRKLKSGLEPLHLDSDGQLDDPRRPRPANGALTKVGTEEKLAERIASSDVSE